LVRVLGPSCPQFDGFDLYLRTRYAAKVRAFVAFLVEKRRQANTQRAESGPM